MNTNTRNPKQPRAIKKKEKIIKVGFELICKNGYHNTNTAEIAKHANVSTGIIYQYFKDKHDIFMESLEKYGDKIFFPILGIQKNNLNLHNFDMLIKNMIEHYIKNHKVSKIAHEEIMAMVHSDQDVANYYYKRELEMTKTIKQILINNNIQDNNLNEKIHISLAMIDNLCHEIVYHKHKNMNYTIMTNIVIENIKNIIK